MKKHVSLFLALLMVVSALFAVPVEAKQLKQTNNEQQQALTLKNTEMNKETAPCVTDSDIGTNAVVTPGIGGGCAHTYKTVSYTASSHTRRCTKCGYTFTASHSIRYKYSSGTTHIKYCSVCGYSTTFQHTFVYEPSGNVHVKRCSLCGYSAGSETHTLSNGVYRSNKLHLATCSKCSISTTVSHDFHYKYSLDPENHEWYCPVCNTSKVENHVKTYVSLSQTMHKCTCSICGLSTWQPVPHSIKIIDAGLSGIYEWCTECDYYWHYYYQ